MKSHVKEPIKEQECAFFVLEIKNQTLERLDWFTWPLVAPEA